MSPNNDVDKNTEQLPDRIPADLSRTIEKTLADQMASEIFRKRVKEIISDEVDTVPFMDKVRGYAGREIDERIFRNGWAIIIFIVSLIITAVVGAFISRFFR